MAPVEQHHTAKSGHPEHDHLDEFATWTYRSEAHWSFNALQRAVEKLSRDKDGQLTLQDDPHSHLPR